MLNNPIRFNDPTGHWFCDLDPDECVFLDESGSGIGSLVIGTSRNENGEEKDGSFACEVMKLFKNPCILDHESLPDKIKEELLNGGADADLIDAVVITVYTTSPFWDKTCWDSLAYHSNGEIVICEAIYFDDDQLTDLLLHELIHFRQYTEDPDFNEHYEEETDINGYENNAYEVEAYECQSLFNAIPLLEKEYEQEINISYDDNTTCDLVP